VGICLIRSVCLPVLAYLVGADEKAPDVGIPEELAKFYFAQICEGMVSLSRSSR
jgi:hypothetical protein